MSALIRWLAISCIVTLPLRTSALLGQATHHTTILTVNGVGFDPAAPNSFEIPLQALLHAKLNWQNLSSDSSAHTLRWFINPSSTSNADPGVICFLNAGSSSAAALLLGAIKNCPDNPAADFFEAFLQSLTTISDAVTKDLTARIAGLLAAHRRVILVPHSQGNLYVREAVAKTTNPECVAVVSIATPSDGRWNSRVYRRSFVAKGTSVQDIILTTLGQSAATTRVQTALATALDASVAAAPVASKPKLLAASMLKLHYVNSYLTDSVAGVQIAAAIKDADSALNASCPW